VPGHVRKYDYSLTFHEARCPNLSIEHGSMSQVASAKSEKVCDQHSSTGSIRLQF
jgi:hypothetical protein